MTDNQFNLESLLQPISEQQPTGEDLRRQISPVYQNLKALRASVRADERRSAVSDEAMETILITWRKIAKDGLQILREESKDLEVAVWVTEAHLRLYGFKGLNDGFNLLQQLLLKFWPALYPVQEGDEGPQHKFVALAGLNGLSSPGALITPIYCTGLVPQSGKSINAWHYQQAAKTETDHGEKMKAIKAAVHLAGRAPLMLIQQHIKDCINTFNNLCEIVAEMSSPAAPPPSSHIRNALQACFDVVTNLLADLPDEKPKISENPQRSERPSGEALADTKHDEPSIASGQPRALSREAAFQSLTELTAFFYKSEPCSPIGYLLEKALRWRNVTLAELLDDLIDDPHSLQMSLRTLGVRLSSQETSMSQERSRVFDEDGFDE